MSKKKRGSRGDDWERLRVSGKITWTDKRLYNRLSPEERNRVRLTVMLAALQGKTSSLGRLHQLTWENPDAPPGTGKRGMPSDREDYHSVTVGEEEIAEHLPTLNRGHWLENTIRYELAKMGGPIEEYRSDEHIGKRFFEMEGTLESQPAMVRPKAQRRRPAKRKKVARIRGRKSSRKKRPSRHHRGVSRK